MQQSQMVWAEQLKRRDPESQQCGYEALYVVIVIHLDVEQQFGQSVSQYHLLHVLYVILVCHRAPSIAHHCCCSAAADGAYYNYCLSVITGANGGMNSGECAPHSSP